MLDPRWQAYFWRFKLYRFTRMGWSTDQLSLRWDKYRVHANVGTFHFLYFRKGHHHA